MQVRDAFVLGLRESIAAATGLPLESIQKAFELATRPTAESLKIVVNPNG